MNASIDISKTISPKSDQLNADDLISGPKTITVTGIKLVAEEQPVAIHFEGDDGKPYKPCKSMRRVLIKAWGPNGAAYVGRSMTLFLDEQVRFGGAAVGGIRISHLTAIDKPLSMALTATRGTKKAYTVQPLKVADSTEYARRKSMVETLENIAKDGQDALKAAWISMSHDDRAIVGQAEIQRIKATVASSESAASQA